jgi:hypothetical protein
MPAKENYSDKIYKPSGSESGQQLVDASKLILLNEYESLLRTTEPTRFLNRSLLIAIVLLELIYAPFSVLYQVPLLITSALASCFWFLQELLMARRLNRLGELIASTSGELITEMKGDYSRPVTLPPLRKESQTSSSHAQVTASTGTGELSSRGASDQSWTGAYVNWRHEARKDKWLRACQRLEPIIWFGLAFAFGIYHVLFALR